MPLTLAQQLKRHGNYLENAVHIIKLCPPSDIFDWYNVELLENYILQKRSWLKKEILAVFKLSHEWLDTGEKVNFDTTFFDHYLGYPGTLENFKKYLTKQISTTQLIIFHSRLVLQPEFRLCNFHLLLNKN